MGWRSGRVRALGRSWTGAQELAVELAHPAGPAPLEQVTALAYPALVGRPEVGDRVLITTGPLDRGLGTGGFAVVVAIPDRLPEPGPAQGHLVKARYTPLQILVQGADEQGSPHHHVLARADELSGAVVVTADLHSALPAIVLGIRRAAPSAQIAYVMTDGGALPAWLSRTVDGLRAAGWIAGCVSTGQAFGGDIEAVSLHSGLLAARLVLGADIIVVSQGPGNLGTGTTWGFSGVAVGEAINAAAVLGGRPVGSLRISQADARERHRGISHHSATAYGRVALAPADLVLPELPGDLGELIGRQAVSLGAPHTPHRIVRVADPGLRAALTESPVPLRTMGRGLDADPAAFIAAAAAGVHAGRLHVDRVLAGPGTAAQEPGAGDRTR
ncbi:MAG: DUF3866 family protein [Angustibacter sp.]